MFKIKVLARLHGEQQWKWLCGNKQATWYGLLFNSLLTSRNLSLCSRMPESSERRTYVGLIAKPEAGFPCEYVAQE